MAKKKEQPVSKEFRFSGSPKRLKDEDFEEYKERRKMLKALEKQKLKGKTIWHSRLLGKYLKEFKGREHEIYDKLQEHADKQNNMGSNNDDEPKV
tara:strand:+ start:280 stop:564 length:285 start_codon:yes stop_codon:yes gene_type:complete